MNREAEVRQSLHALQDPDLRRELGALDAIKDVRVDDAGRVAFTIELAKPAGPGRAQVEAEAEDRVRRLSWVTDVTIFIAPRPRAPAAPTTPTRPPGLARVVDILAVSSCKGGVGKSTVAVNLAYSLSRAGARVGLFDADVYGPSLPTMVAPAETDVHVVGDLIQPLQHEGVRLMSFGYVNAGPEGGPAIMRGPMVSQVINQLLTTTAWGELDYLVIDFPPGTGDIQLTLMQLVPISAAVIVTTPQQLSFVDVVKGIQMFDKLKVPTVAVVENMSYYQCPKCGDRQYLFGQGARRQLVEQFGIRNSFEIPIYPEISRQGDAGQPIVLAQPEGPVAAHYRDLADSVHRELKALRDGRTQPPALRYQVGRGILVTLAGGEEKVLHPATLRRACRCAHCVDEFSGRSLLRPEAVSEQVYPTAFQTMGNYAVAITWSDGHTSSIYPYDAILALTH